MYTSDHPMKFNGFVLLVFSITYNDIVLAEAPVRQNVLATTYSQNTALCTEFHTLYSSFKSCPLTDGYCFTFKWESNDDPVIRKVPLKELAVNQYGYTQINVAYPTDKRYTIVYLNGFQGDHNPRITETWKVNTKELEALTEQVPHPMTYSQRVEAKQPGKKETYAPEFALLLSHGEKLSDDWSVWLPIFEVRGANYAVTRECAGEWVFGGDYSCDRIIKITIKHIDNERKAIPVCEFSNPKKK